MRSKAPLVMMEQLVMVLVFALTAALCVQVFVLSEKLSVKTTATDKAAIMAQNIAECMKEGNPEEFLMESDAALIEAGVWEFGFDENWNVTKIDDAEYRMKISFEEENDLLWQARIVVFMKDGAELFSIPVAAQKVREG